MQIMNTEKAAAHRAWSNSDHSQRYGLTAALLIAAVLFALAAGGRPVFAHDELRLTGVIKTINPANGLVYVEVGSQSCRGMRIFRADNLDTLSKLLGQRISFYIDSSTCSDNKVHTIVVSRGVGK